MAGLSEQDAIRLSAEILAELELLGRAAKDISSLRTSAEESAPAALALLLHNYYTGAESIFVRITKAFGGTSEETGRWHRQLLEDAALDLASIRPAIIARDTQQQLGMLLGFRHVVRNLYSWRLDPVRLDALAAVVPVAHARLSADLTRFVDFLRKLAEGESDAT